MNDTQNPNVIPLRDVTEEQARAEALADSLEKVVARIKAGEPFLFASLGVKGEDGGRHVTVHSNAENYDEFLGCLMGGVSTLGLAELGDGAANMPPELLQPVAMSTGLRAINETARAAFAKMGVGDSKTEH